MGVLCIHVFGFPLVWVVGVFCCCGCFGVVGGVCCIVWFMDDELMVRRLDLLEAQIVRVQSDVSRVLVELGVLAGELRALGVLPYEPRLGTLGAVNPTVKDLWC
jgi:hypothetical protein